MYACACMWCSTQLPRDQQDELLASIAALPIRCRHPPSIPLIVGCLVAPGSPQFAVCLLYHTHDTVLSRTEHMLYSYSVCCSTALLLLLRCCTAVVQVRVLTRTSFKILTYSSIRLQSIQPTQELEDAKSLYLVVHNSTAGRFPRAGGLHASATSQLCRVQSGGRRRRERLLPDAVG